jgi:surface antigen
VGGVVGSQIGIDHGNREVTTVLGAVAGVLVGKSIGKKMDDADKRCTAEVFENAKNGQTVTWRNPDQGTEYRLTPVDTFDGPNGPCRTYTSVVTASGQRDEGKKVACRNGDGTWNVTTASRM